MKQSDPARDNWFSDGRENTRPVEQGTSEYNGDGTIRDPRTTITTPAVPVVVDPVAVAPPLRKPVSTLVIPAGRIERAKRDTKANTTKTEPVKQSPKVRDDKTKKCVTRPKDNTPKKGGGGGGKRKFRPWGCS